MPALLRQLSPAGWLAAALCAATGAEYLPAVGPPAIRFEKPAPDLMEPRVVLPPLAVIEPRPTVLPAEPSTPLPQPGPLAPAEPANPIADGTSLAPTVAPHVPVLILDPLATNAVPADPGVLGPQMFMKYFTGQPGTNGNGVSIFAPIGFVPPLPVPPQSSSATFQTVPPGKP